MRSVNKGESPQAEFRPYGKALDDLVDRLGPFCSYCEQVITHAPEVEHVQPKSLVPGLEYSWDNFLLGCKSCNSVKGKNPVDLAGVAFPDADNTFRGLEFRPDGSINITTGLGPAETGLMEAVVKLVKLHRHPAAIRIGDRPTKRDKRVELRLDVWDIASRQLANYEEFVGNPEVSELLAQIIASDLAPAKGFFSIWVTVFHAHPCMIHRFVAAFPGTDPACFNAAGSAIRRPTGRL